MKNRIKDIAKHAVSHVCFYKKYKQELYKIMDLNEENINDNEDIRKVLDVFPIVDKDDLRNVTEFLSDDYSKTETKKWSNIICARTSGSSGRYLEVFRSVAEDRKLMLPLWILRKKYYNISTSDKMLYFFTVHNMDSRKENIYEFRKNILGVSKSALGRYMEDICNKIVEFAPVWITTQPSIALLLAKGFEKYKISVPKSIKYIELTGEMLEDNVRDKIEEMFDCQIANQYGCNEVNSIAFQCPYGNMHIIDENIYVEVIDEYGNRVRDEEYGEIVITSGLNKIMPIIRYKIGDVGNVCNEQYCRCGKKGNIIKLKKGRVSTFALNEEGKQISIYSFVRAIEIVNRIYNNIIEQYQIEQIEKQYYIVRFVIEDNEYSKEELMELEDVFLHSINDEDLFNSEFSFEYFEEFLPDNETGKFSCFVPMKTINLTEENKNE